MTVRNRIASAIKNADWQLFLEDYGQQADAVLRALRQAGYAIVPVEPNTDMLRAGAKALEFGEFKKADTMTVIFQAMVKEGMAKPVKPRVR